MNAPSTVDPPTKPFRRPRVSRAAAEDDGSDAVTVTTALGTATTSAKCDTGAGAARTDGRPSPIAITPVRPPAPRVRRLPGPSETGRFPSPKPRTDEGSDATTTAVSRSALASTPAPAAAPGPPVSVAPALSPSVAPAPAPSAAPAPVVRPAAPVVPGTSDSAAALERAGLVGLHPLTREQPVRGGTRRLVAQVPAPYSVVGDGEDVPALLTRMYAMVVRDHWGGGEGDTTHVVQLTPWWVCDLGFELVNAGRILGHAPVHGDVTPDLPVDPPEPESPFAAAAGVPTPTLLSLRHPVVDDRARAALGDASRVIVVADTARSDRRTIQGSMAALGDLGTVVAGLVVYRGRIPRDPAYGR